MNKRAVVWMLCLSMLNLGSPLVAQAGLVTTLQAVEASARAQDLATVNTALAREECVPSSRRSVSRRRRLSFSRSSAANVKEFYENNKTLAQDLARLAGRPILVELWNERYFYFVMKFEFNVIDSMKKASALSTVQIDVENGKRFNITYADEIKEKNNTPTSFIRVSQEVSIGTFMLYWNGRQLK